MPKALGSQRLLLVTGFLAALLLTRCSMLATRPVQEMSDTAAAIRAAREVQADTLAPELYRQASEWFFKAKHEYKFKNFDLARKYSDKARLFAESAEFEAIRNGGNRSSSDPVASDPMAPGLAAPVTQPTPTPQAEPYAYPTPTGIPAGQFPGGGGGGTPPAGTAPSP